MSISDRECPSCDGPVDEDGDTTQADPECPAAGYWTHPGDCDTCGHIDCDGSC